MAPATTRQVEDRHLPRNAPGPPFDPGRRLDLTNYFPQAGFNGIDRV